MRAKLKVINVGGSRAIVIPAKIAKAEGIEVGDIVEVEIKK